MIRTRISHTLLKSTLAALSILLVNEHEIMTGDGGLFHPNQVLVREQAAAILVRLQKLMPEVLY
ncbi:hypothetical protein D3C76_272020 [compost metagenome]